MADFDDYRTRNAGQDHLVRNIVVVAVVMAAAFIGALLLVSGEKAAPTDDEKTAAASPTPADVTPPPAPSPTPAATPAGSHAFFTDGNLQVLAFRLNGSLDASLKEALPDELKDLATPLAGRLSEALRWKLDPRRELRPGDEAKIIFNPQARTEHSPLYGFRYKSGRLGKELFYVYFPDAKGSTSFYFDKEGNSIAETIQRPPLRNEDMQMATVRNLADRGMFFQTEPGTKVIMPFPARVLRLNWDQEKLGRSVEVRYMDSGVVAWFCHLEAISDIVQEGAIISSDSVFASTGATGDTANPGLLYRTFRQPEGETAQPINPLEVHEKQKYQLPSADRVQFLALRTKVEQLLEKVALPPAAASKD